MRTSCKEYSIRNFSNKMMHLTNDAIQKKSPEYGKHELGNKLSFADYAVYFDGLYDV